MIINVKEKMEENDLRIGELKKLILYAASYCILPPKGKVKHII